jgi:hypothetical protein
LGGKLGRPYEDDPDVVARPRRPLARGGARLVRPEAQRARDRGDARGITRGIDGDDTDRAPSHHFHRMAIDARLPADWTPVRADPSRCLTPQERGVIEALEMERRCATRNGGWENIDASQLRHAQDMTRWLVEQRKGDLARGGGRAGRLGRQAPA